MAVFYLTWIDDVPSTIDSYKGHFDLLKVDYDAEFIIDPHYDTKNLDIIARNITDDLIFFIDYNLKSNTGEGLDGHEVIKIIRDHNANCPIVFYSSNATQKDLKELVKHLPFVKPVTREQLVDILNSIANGTFSC